MEHLLSDPANIVSHVDDAGHRLISIPLPQWYLNQDIKVAFRQRPSWDAITSAYPLSVAPGLASVLSSPTPPSLSFFKSLPKPSRSKLQWGDYVLVLERPGYPPIVYPGSGTDSDGGIRARERCYLNGSGPFGSIVQRALATGYTITSFGMLCWTDFPAARHEPRLRTRLLVLEAVFTIIFCACVRTIMDSTFIPDLFIWKREDISWLPGCTHLSLSESVRGDLELTDEELELATAARAQRKVEKTQRYRQRQREQDEKSFLQRSLDQHNNWADENRDRVNEIAAGVRQRAKDSGRFRCDVCDLNLATQYALEDHCKSDAHAAAVKHGSKVTKPLLDSSHRQQATRAANKAFKRYFCKPCNKPCSTASDLKRHETKKKHLVAAQKARDAGEPAD